MSNQFVSINDASKLFKVSTNTIRKIVRNNVDTSHVQKQAIKGKHGFKYVISIDYLNSIYNDNKLLKNDTTNVKNDYSSNKQSSNEIDTQSSKQIDKLYKQIDKQNLIIEKLTDTVSEQNKIIVAQSMQVHQLTSSNELKQKRQDLTYFNLESIIIIVLVVCIVAVIAYLFR